MNSDKDTYRSGSSDRLPFDLNLSSNNLPREYLCFENTLASQSVETYQSLHPDAATMMRKKKEDERYEECLIRYKQPNMRILPNRYRVFLHLQYEHSSRAYPLHTNAIHLSKLFRDRHSSRSDTSRAYPIRKNWARLAFEIDSSIESEQVPCPFQVP